MKLLVDLGNTRLKWATETQAQLSSVTAMDYRQPDFLQNLIQLWQTLPPPEIVAIATVANRQLLQDLLQLCQQLWPQAQYVLPESTDSAFGVSNAYHQPEKLGIDRWLALIAAHHIYPGFTCVVDCGTAITIDVLNVDGLHRGGVIVPGLRLMQQALATNTADLGFNRQAHQIALAQHTDAGIANGVLAAAVGAIETICQQLDGEFQLLMTGGDADVIASALSIPSTIDVELVLKGLSIYCQAAW